MGSDVPIRVSKELRTFLKGQKTSDRETYDMLLKRKLMDKRARKELLKKKMLPNLMPGKATKAVFNSDKKATKEFLQYR